MADFLRSLLWLLTPPVVAFGWGYLAYVIARGVGRRLSDR